LEFSDIESFSFSDSSNNLIEKVWANTEFICTLTHRYVSILLWDNNTGDKNYVRYYSLYNSKLQKEALDIIKRNSKIDITPYQEKYNPDRRDNLLLNTSIHKLLENMDEATGDAVLGYAEKTAETLSGNDYTAKQSRIVAHEIKNQLSICDLYSEIMKKHLEAGNLEEIKNSIHSINKALKMANNTLLSLKSMEKAKTQKISLKEIIDETADLTKIYTELKNIDLLVENTEDVYVIADNEKLISVIINLVKNATEAFDINETMSDIKNGKYIKIKTETNEESAIISISNNAPGISEPEKIFNEGFTTKTKGSGLGLWICKKTIEKIGGTLELSRSSEDFTEFSIELSLAE
jgi:signal transduction histidine kinase